MLSTGDGIRTPRHLRPVGQAATNLVAELHARAASHPPGAPPPGDPGPAIVAWAELQLGVPFQPGGGSDTGPTAGSSAGAAGQPGWDCSGLTMYAVYQATSGKSASPTPPPSTPARASGQSPTVSSSRATSSSSSAPPKPPLTPAMSASTPATRSSSTPPTAGHPSASTASPQDQFFMRHSSRAAG